MNTERVPTPGERELDKYREQLRAMTSDDVDLLSVEEGIVTRLKAMSSPRGLAEALDAYDDAIGALSDASSRASVARNAHPSAAMRVSCS